MLKRKNLIDRIKKVQCDHMLTKQELGTFHSDMQMNWIRTDMYNKLIDELRKNGFIEETVEDTPDYKRFKMRLLVVEPEEFDEE